MIKKFIGDVWAGVVQISRPRGPVWITTWYWADRYDAWREARGPRRPVSRSRVVRYAKAVMYQLGPAGWLWAALAAGWFLWSTRGTGSVNVLVTAAGCVACIRVGMAWSRRNTVLTIEWEEECPCRKAEEGP